MSNEITLDRVNFVGVEERTRNDESGTFRVFLFESVLFTGTAISVKKASVPTELTMDKALQVFPMNQPLPSNFKIRGREVPTYSFKKDGRTITANISYKLLDTSDEKQMAEYRGEIDLATHRKFYAPADEVKAPDGMEVPTNQEPNKPNELPAPDEKDSADVGAEAPVGEDVPAKAEA